MSMRQLAMVESINNVNGALQSLVSAQNALKSKVEGGFRELNERVDNLAESHGILETRFDEFDDELSAGPIPPT